jgi:hypothetical protein
MSDFRVTLGAVNVQAANPTTLAKFWSEMLGSTVSSDGSYLPPAGPGGFAMFFRPLDGRRPRDQIMHVDLSVAWGDRQAVVARALALGATYQWDVLTEYEHVQWTTLTDPEGNLFCVAEHPPLPS